MIELPHKLYIPGRNLKCPQFRPHFQPAPIHVFWYTVDLLIQKRIGRNEMKTRWEPNYEIWVFSMHGTFYALETAPLIKHTLHWTMISHLPLRSALVELKFLLLTSENCVATWFWANLPIARTPPNVVVRITWHKTILNCLWVIAQNLPNNSRSKTWIVQSVFWATEKFTHTFSLRFGRQKLFRSGRTIIHF